jgi:RHS repeat-associated protein
MSMTQTGYNYDSTIYYRARYYDPSIGRFLSEDPVRFWGGIDFYKYVDNSPTGSTDP